MNKIKELKNIFFKYQDGHSTKRVVDYIQNYMKNIIH